MMTIQLFQRVPEVLEYYQRKFQYIHVDEYQDTNRAQYILLNYWRSRLKIFVSLGTPINPFIDGEERTLPISFPLKRIIQMQKLFFLNKTIVQQNEFYMRQIR